MSEDRRPRSGWLLPALVLAAGGGWTSRVPLGAEGSTWRTVAPGLEVGRLASPRPAPSGSSIVTVVRVDPERYEFRLLSARLLGLRDNPSAPEWVDRHGVLGVVNASMFQADHKTSTAHMRDGEAINNASWSKDRAVFASQPREAGPPAAQIIDRTCQDLKALAGKYRVLVQSIRMIDCQGRNVWAPQPRKWSTACVGTDLLGRVLLIHVRAPYSTHDLVDILLALPLGLKRLMYVEGGPEASLYVRAAGQVVVSEMGSFETGFLERDDNTIFWPLPNVIGFAPRTTVEKP